MNDGKLKAKDLLLDYYHCTFFLPLIGLQEEEFSPKLEPFKYHPLGNTEVTAEQAQAYHYFSPALRNILFDTSIEKKVRTDNNSNLIPVKEWRLPLLADAPWRLHLGKDDNKDDPLRYQSARITAVTLYRYFNGIYLLSFRAEPEALILLREEQNRIRQDLRAEAGNVFPDDKDRQDAWVEGQLDAQGCSLFSKRAPRTIDTIERDDAHKSQYMQLRMESWLRFTRQVRLIYPSFPEQSDEKKIAPIRLEMPAESITAFESKMAVEIPDPPGKQISPVIRRLLKAFDPVSSVDSLLDQYSRLTDDRMFVSVAYGLAHTELPRRDLPRLFSLVTIVDRQEDTFKELDGYAYTPREIRKRLEPTSMCLWQGLGGLYGYTGFSNAYLYSGDFFRNIVAPNHIVWIYDRMLVQALLYRASLQYYDDRICNETENILSRQHLENIREQRKEFIRFTNQYWFHDLTNQWQGREIFRLQQQAIGLSHHYDIIKDELERTDEYLQSSHQIKMAGFTERFTFWGSFIAIVALWVSIIPIVLKSFIIKSKVGLTQLRDSINLHEVLTDIYVVSVVGVPTALFMLFLFWRLYRRFKTTR